MIRINKFLSEQGICSRREADKLISAGRVKINNQIASLGMNVDNEDLVYVDDNLVEINNKEIFIAFNKPVGLVCTTEIREGYTNIYEYLNLKDRVFSIGRLDKDSSGLLILTNNGDVANKLSKSCNNHEKEYIVEVDKKIDDNFIANMSQGVEILDTITKPCQITKIDDYTFDIILTQGLNRQIRRMCDKLGYVVTKLKRIRFVNINLGDLKEGEYRNLDSDEIKGLK